MAACINRKRVLMHNGSAERKAKLKRAIEEKVASLLTMIDDTPIAHNAQELYDTEKKIAAMTDEIAGFVTEAVVSDSVSDAALNTEAKKLVKQAAVRMKNRGAREVTIKPYRGNPFTIEADYYAKTGVSRQKADKKGGSTLS
jgi:hypothetical protein